MEDLPSGANAAAAAASLQAAIEHLEQAEAMSRHEDSLSPKSVNYHRPSDGYQIVAPPPLITEAPYDFSLSHFTYRSIIRVLTEVPVALLTMLSTAISSTKYLLYLLVNVSYTAIITCITFTWHLFAIIGVAFWRFIQSLRSFSRTAYHFSRSPMGVISVILVLMVALSANSGHHIPSGAGGVAALFSGPVGMALTEPLVVVRDSVQTALAQAADRIPMGQSIAAVKVLSEQAQASIGQVYTGVTALPQSFLAWLRQLVDSSVALLPAASSLPSVSLPSLSLPALPTAGDFLPTGLFAVRKPLPKSGADADADADAEDVRPTRDPRSTWSLRQLLDWLRALLNSMVPGFLRLDAASGPGSPGGAGPFVPVPTPARPTIPSTVVAPVGDLDVGLAEQLTNELLALKSELARVSRECTAARAHASEALIVSKNVAAAEQPVVPAAPVIAEVDPVQLQDFVRSADLDSIISASGSRLLADLLADKYLPDLRAEVASQIEELAQRFDTIAQKEASILAQLEGVRDSADRVAILEALYAGVEESPALSPLYAGLSKLGTSVDDLAGQLSDEVDFIRKAVPRVERSAADAEEHARMARASRTDIPALVGQALLDADLQGLVDRAIAASKQQQQQQQQQQQPEPAAGGVDPKEVVLLGKALRSMNESLESHSERLTDLSLRIDLMEQNDRQLEGKTIKMENDLRQELAQQADSLFDQGQQLAVLESAHRESSVIIRQIAERPAAASPAQTPPTLTDGHLSPLKDYIGQVDHALQSAGASIYYPMTTAPRMLARPTDASADRQSLIGRLFSNRKKTRPTFLPSPETVLRSYYERGWCYEFGAQEGAIGIRLPYPIIVSGFTIDHIDPAIAPSSGSAPKRVSLNAYDPLTESSVQVARGIFKVGEGHSSIQTFDVLPMFQTSTIAHQIFVLRVFDNHSTPEKPESTCLYRVRIHGQRV
ncbi:hypothetical protein H696_00763 [Fonticula alba]|uniref:SUN domain-containing protein n=1 Tax=Fonticula alba TaxID=691883 RepID=A0A058ZGX7_FONAL|nr:hypothetical protein H696_00763 [Fonticula alba]KCV73221.1 hypothetical protein H696_00763 [Fonticula alba]|eukprot:XP_009492922.1 hypothetical protein H696_00763 [Fonticula alba]